MPPNLQSFAYLFAALLFIFSLRGLSAQETARRGNTFGAVGMLVAVLATAIGLALGGDPGGEAQGGALGAGMGEAAGALGAALGVGALVGGALASRVAMTQMPELVAMLHSFVGAAAVLVGLATYLAPEDAASAANKAHLAEIFVGVFVGAITFTGSVIAFFKLRGSIGGRPLLLPGRHVLNAGAALGCAALGVLFLREGPPSGLVFLLAMTAVALLLGAHLVLAIGGGDMPVVVSLLNSYSGWAAAAAGFMLANDLLIVTGALVGASGAILSSIMCKAMNRSLVSVVFGGFGAEAKAGAGGKTAPAGRVQEVTAEGCAELLGRARRVVVVPGYGMAVAQAQHAVRDVTSLLAARGVKVAYAIHPVAGRLPGHMNVLLAEAGVPYDVVHEMDEINGELPDVDVVVVIGANDIVNPSAMDDPESPIFGMPVLEVWKAGKVVMLKRGMSAGYAGVDNPLCYEENTLMLFGDAKQSVQKVRAALEAK